MIKKLGRGWQPSYREGIKAKRRIKRRKWSWKTLTIEKKAKLFKKKKMENRLISQIQEGLSEAQRLIQWLWRIFICFQRDQTRGLQWKTNKLLPSPTYFSWWPKKLERVHILKQDGRKLMFSKQSRGQGSKGDLKKESDIKNCLKQTAGGQKAAASIRVREDRALCV